LYVLRVGIGTLYTFLFFSDWEWNPKTSKSRFDPGGKPGEFLGNPNPSLEFYEGIQSHLPDISG